MPVKVSKKSHFADVVLRAVLSIDSGQTRTATFTHSGDGKPEAVTVGGVWVDGAFSWRLVEGVHAEVRAGEGVELFTGFGGDLDATTAAMRLAWSLGVANGGEWALHG